MLSWLKRSMSTKLLREMDSSAMIPNSRPWSAIKSKLGEAPIKTARSETLSVSKHDLVLLFPWSVTSWLAEMRTTWCWGNAWNETNWTMDKKVQKIVQNSNSTKSWGTFKCAFHIDRFVFDRVLLILGAWNSSNFKYLIHSTTKKQSRQFVWKSLKMSRLNFKSLTFSVIFCPIKIDLSGITVWQQATVVQKLAKIERFWHF